MKNIVNLNALNAIMILNAEVVMKVNNFLYKHN